MVGCIIHTGYINYNGYGSASLNNKTIGAHRKAWVLKNGPIPDGMVILHKCDNRACINTDHLLLGTQYDNMHDCINKGRKNYKGPSKTKDGLRPCKACGKSFPETYFHKNGITKVTKQIKRKHVCKFCRRFGSRYV